MPSSSLWTERVVVVPPERGYPFYVTAKCYVPNAHNHNAEPAVAPATLLLLHSTSFHKEIYEPTLEELFAIVRRRTGSTRATRNGTEVSVRIGEVWAVDCPNHGQAAVLNYELLRLPEYKEYFGCESYAEAVLHFLSSRDAANRPHIAAPPEEIVGIGHSLGGVAMICLAQALLFKTVILVDPFVFPGRPEDLLELMKKFTKAAFERRDVWPSKEDARKSLKWRKWDPRVVDVYLEHGLRQHPEWNHAVAAYHGYTTACTREQEATMYLDWNGATRPVRFLADICMKGPVHIIFGDNADIIPRYVQDGMVDEARERYASVTRLQDVGHLIPQCAPRALATALYSIVAGTNSFHGRTKL